MMEEKVEDYKTVITKTTDTVVFAMIRLCIIVSIIVLIITILLML